MHVQLSLRHSYTSQQYTNVWNLALSNEIDKLVQGIRDIKDNDAVDSIQLSAVPKYKKVAYANMIYDHQPLKTKITCPAHYWR